MSLNNMMILTTEANAVDSLEHALEALKNTRNDPMALKWFIIALHHATHCFMLAALAGSAQQGIWQEPIKYQKRDDRIARIDIFHPKNRLLNFLAAYKGIKDPKRMKSYIHSKPFTASDTHDEAMKFLNDDLRNTLVHFRPIVTGMDPDYIAQCAPVLDIVEFLLFESGQIIHLAPGYDIAKLRVLIQGLKFETALVAGNE